MIILNRFILLLFSLFALSCQASSDFTRIGESEKNLECNQDVFNIGTEARIDSPLIERDSRSLDDQTLKRESEQILKPSGEDKISTEYPLPPCAFSLPQQALIAVFLETYPQLRSDSTFVVKTMEDFRYIFQVLKPRCGTLYNFFRFEFDFDAITSDLKTLQDFAYFNKILK